MKFGKFAIKALLVVLGTQMLSASDFEKNNILQFQIKKNNEIIESGYSLFSSEMGRESGIRQGLLHYKCSKNADKTTQIIGIEMHGINNFSELKCSLNTSSDATCELKIYNVISKDNEAIKEFEAKSCKAVSPDIIVNKYNFILKKNSMNDIKLTNGYSFLYSFQEEK